VESRNKSRHYFRTRPFTRRASPWGGVIDRGKGGKKRPGGKQLEMILLGQPLQLTLLRRRKGRGQRQDNLQNEKQGGEGG